MIIINLTAVSHVFSVKGTHANEDSHVYFRFECLFEHEISMVIFHAARLQSMINIEISSVSSVESGINTNISNISRVESGINTNISLVIRNFG